MRSRSRRECERAALRQGPAQVDRIGRVLARLQSRKYELVPGVPFKFGPFLNDSARHFPRLIPARKPTYVFDATGSKTHESRNDGLNVHGPYTNAVQAMVPPKICVICQESQKAQVEQFLRIFFFNGVKLRPSHREGKQPKNYFAKAFAEKYAIEIPPCKYFLADGPSAAAYYNACQEALEAHGNGQPWDLALIQIEEASITCRWHATHTLSPKRASRASKYRFKSSRSKLHENGVPHSVTALTR